MAEVLAPVLSPTGSINMLQPRPSSADAFHNSSASQGQNQAQRMSNAGRYNNQHNNVGYRGTASPPIAPYAFQATPHLRFEQRSASAPSNPTGQTPTPFAIVARQGHLASSSTSTASSSASSGPSERSTNPSSQDDSAISSKQRPAAAAAAISLSTAVPDLSLTNFDTPAKPSPDRYRRGKRTETPVNNGSQPLQQHAGSARPSGSGMANVNHLFNQPVHAVNTVNVQPGLSYASVAARNRRTSSADETNVPGQGEDLAKRYRRRSLGNLSDLSGLKMTPIKPVEPTKPASPPATNESRERRPSINDKQETAHARSNSSDSVTSVRPGPARRNSSSSNTGPPLSPGQVSPKAQDTTKRPANPSPLSRPAITEDESRPSSAHGRQAASTKPTTSSPLANSSPAVQQLAALSEKDAKGKKSSMLRRAFSFGGSNELKRAMANNAAAAEAAHKVEAPNIDELDDEDQEIARRQEAAGIGAGIYSGQGGFSGSTDNLSISSTASSASIMLRKMGKGMKKGGRSIKGLFRPKSVVGVSPADTPVTNASVGPISMVTVEAEREKVNVNAHPADQPGGGPDGGTGFPHLERNSMDAGAVADPYGDSRKSIVGSDKERAEVLNSVRKGILKRTGTSSTSSSPTTQPMDAKNVPSLPTITHMADSPASSQPSTPVDGRSATPTGSHDDYFTQRFGSQTKLGPGTSPRGIHFSPRIQFHDAWSSADYDRRGDIATCNRLTPMLAQQIKEELNTFKMEMEVHESSKPHTHFF